MSFILDALKKSETDRQQHSGAEFVGIPVSPRPRSVPRWLWVVGVLLAVNLIVLVSLMLQSDSVPVEQSLLPDDGRTAQNALDHTGTPSFEDQVAVARRKPPAKQGKLPVANSVESAPEFVRPILISQDPSAIPSDELYPTLQEVSASGAFSLPELHLDIHVYSADPENRFVFINMSKLREGSQLNEGPVVAEITPDGVVLGHQGQLFLLPRE